MTINIVSMMLTMLMLSGLFSMNLTGADTGSVHPNLFEPYKPPITVNFQSEYTPITFTYKKVCCPPAIIGTSDKPITITCQNFTLATIYQTDNLFYYAIPDWQLPGYDNLTISQITNQ